MDLLAALRRLDARTLGPAPVAATVRGTLLPYVLIGALCAGLPALFVVLSGGSVLVAAGIAALGLLPPGVAALTGVQAGRAAHR